ncbi:MAG TPA: DinB family protein [Gemmatimonadaceae bacterium]|nr:DinB family protein [Gemmatimonadaceae bacterium]
MTSRIARPAPDEYSPSHAGYVARVPEGDVRGLLRSQLGTTLALLRVIPEARGDHRYAEGKWTLKEVLGHMSDTERIMSYRALRIARGDTTPLPGFEQDDYVPNGNFAVRSIASLAEELEAVRRATIILFQHLSDAALERRGTASEHPVTPRALAYVIAGHELHHTEIIRTRYLESS